MEVRTSFERLTAVQADVLVVPVAQQSSVGAAPEFDAAGELDAAMGGELSRAVGAGDFSGEFGQTALFYTLGRLSARKVLLLGLGKAEALTPWQMRRAGGIGARAARSSGAERIAIAVPAVAGGAHAVPTVAQFLTEGALHGLYRNVSLKTVQKPQPQVTELTIVGSDAAAAGVERGRALAEAQNLARSVNWLPGNHLTATRLGQIAEEVCREAGIEVAVYDKQGCQDLGLGLLLAVNQGSVEEPRFIVMRYRGNGGQGPWLGLVGKGVTFDTGGISIKPSNNMWDMKYDMSGAGAVLGAMTALAELKPACDVIGIIAATDNMPDGGAYKPGDVVSGLSGKTVEIRSTDAEGRLVLADGLAYAIRQGATKLVTVSTLTGAADVALGPIRFALVANDNAWEEQVFTAAEEAGERGWRLPHDADYNDLFKSPIADMANIGKGAGTILGGMFLLGHVGETPCVHMDIAAAAYRNGSDGYEDEGPTGVAVKTMVRAAERFAAARER